VIQSITQLIFVSVFDMTTNFIHSALFVKVLSLEETLEKMTPFLHSYRALEKCEGVDTPLPQPVRTESEEVTVKEECVEKEEIVEKECILAEEPPSISPLPNNIGQNLSQRRSPKLFVSHQEDTLFWAIYIHMYGYGAYLQIGNKYKNAELEEKHKIMMHLKANMPTYKMGVMDHKMTNVDMQEVQSELMTNRKTSLLTLYVLCVYYKIPLTLVKEVREGFVLYHEFCPREQSTDSVNIYYRHGKYGLYMEEGGPVFDKATAFRMESIYKPLRAVSSYKVAELENLFDTIVKPELTAEEVAVKRKKGDVYEAIVQRCLW